MQLCKNMQNMQKYTKYAKKPKYAIFQPNMQNHRECAFV